jgi:DNA-nicking Smr family endonuclease
MSDDDALWDEIKKSIKPLRKGAVPKKSEKPQRSVKSPASAGKKQLPQVLAVTSEPPRATLPPLASMDRRARNRIARGNIEIGARLDLHGHRLVEAKDRLMGFLERAQDKEIALVLVITGKGTVAPAGAERGVLKREVPMWLSSAEFRPLVIGYEEASPSHGGSGALYVRVRKRR